ncbi:hypothetical protein WMY93_011623 [Mugilogobius chulae]|uniref:Spermatogenesis associated 22 n=1 Tax=Mugilogobius chulae TaxID=88201 RepID=A0AAW0PC11_9GOBI
MVSILHQEQKVYTSPRPAPRAAPTVRQYAPLPHPYKQGNINMKGEQSNYSVRQKDTDAGVKSGFNQYQPQNNHSRPAVSQSGTSQMCQQPSYKPPNASFKFSQTPVRQPPPPKSAPQPSLLKNQQPSKVWNFTNSFGPQRPAVEQKKGSNVKARPTFQIKPANEISLRILSAVIDGMRHWSQFRDKVPHLFELFATLDSAVTLGPHGGKNFLVRDGKEVVQCVYYENEKELPRLIRGQVHRCVGNYDRVRNVLVCVSIRPALPSEQRNAQEAVRVCDAEMRALVKTFSEV